MPALPPAFNRALALATAMATGCAMAATAGAWEPTRTVEFVVPAGTGGGADQMARMIQGVIQKNELMEQSLVVINKSGGAGAEGFLDVKASAGNPNKIVITLSNVFTTPLATGVPFNYADITPVAMLAMDQFILWVNAKSPYQTAADYVAALKASSAGQMKMGGTGLQAGGPDHHRRDRAGDRRQAHLRPVQGRRRRGGAAGRPAHRFQRQQPDRGGLAVACRRAAPLVRVRGRADGVHRAGRRRQVLGRHPDLHRGRAADRVSDDARDLHHAGRHRRSRSPTIRACWRRCVRTPEWQEFVARGAFADDYKTGEEFNDLARRRVRPAQDADGAGGLPRQVERR